MSEGKIIASCGHEVHSGNDLFPVEYPVEDYFAEPVGYDCAVKMFAVFCRECADKIGEIGGRVVTEIGQPHKQISG